MRPGGSPEEKEEVEREEKVGEEEEDRGRDAEEGPR